MALYLVQHGKSNAKEVDPERGLSGEGEEEARRIAGVAAQYRVRVGAIVHSGKKRARQTAEIFGRTLAPSGGVAAREGLNPLDEVSGLAPSLDPSANLMIVGHLPFLSRLASFLVTGDAGSEIFAFQNSGIVCLDRNEEGGRWVIRWTLMPRIG